MRGRVATTLSGRRGVTTPYPEEPAGCSRTPSCQLYDGKPFRELGRRPREALNGPTETSRERLKPRGNDPYNMSAPKSSPQLCVRDSHRSFQSCIGRAVNYQRCMSRHGRLDWTKPARFAHQLVRPVQHLQTSLYDRFAYAGKAVCRKRPSVWLHYA